MLDNENLMEVLPILRMEYDKAVTKHPKFPHGQGAISIIAEELGELAKEMNDGRLIGWRKRALIEAAHVAVTAIRTMEMLNGGVQGGTCLRRNDPPEKEKNPNGR